MQHRHMRLAGRRLPSAVSALPLLLLLFAAASGPLAAEAPESVIVQAASTAEAAALVRAAGGTVTHELGVIRSVAAELTAGQRAGLDRTAGIRRIWDNATAELTGKPDKGDKGGGGGGGGGTSQVIETFYSSHLGADLLHAAGIDGTGVTIAVLDSGIFSDNGIKQGAFGDGRLLAIYDASEQAFSQDQQGDAVPGDEFGHGSHVTSIAISSRQTSAGNYNGMAPNAELLVVRAFDATGTSSYATVIHGIDWVVANKDAYGIRVLNCSFSAEPRSYYWDDPLNQAVMEAWRAGIVVVASAGNRGPAAMTIGVPGNVPYVITVGAMTDNFTPENMSDDVLASFSSAGPTAEAFVKPEIVAPGGHVMGLMKSNMQIAQDHPEFHDGGYYFNMSGTSQATAFVSGTVALMLQQTPQLTPDEVKWRLMASANGASFSGGSPVYSVFQQGAGRLDAYGAVHTSATGSGNRGLDIDADLAGSQHFRGTADAYKKKGKNGGYVFFIRAPDGTAIEDDGFLWSDEYVFEDGFLWSDAFLWSDGLVWSDALLWSDGLVWSDALLWSDGFVWSDLQTETLFTESWIPQE